MDHKNNERRILDPDLLEELHRGIRQQTPPGNTVRRRLIDHVKNYRHPTRTTDATIWRPYRTGIRLRLLNADANGMVSMLWKVEPGAGIPPHYHHQADECLVVEGELMVGRQLLRKGDYLLGRKDEWHPTIYSPRGATVYVRAHVPPLAEATR